jgi:glycine oxidase
MNVVSDRQRVAVVGGGVVGCATAYELVRAGLDVTLVERDSIGAHASGSNAGNLNPLFGTPAALIPLALEAFEIHSEIRDELAKLGRANYSMLPVKRVHLGFDEADRQKLEETDALFNATNGFSSAWLDSNALREIEPRLASDICWAIVTTGGLSIDSYDFTRSLADSAVHLGATILYETVEGVTVVGGRVTDLHTSKGRVACDALVLATGPWVAEMKQWLDIDLAVHPVRGELLLMRMPGETLRFDFTWRSTCLYLRRENEVWVGGTWDDCGFDCALTARSREMLLDGAARIIPAIRHAELLDHIAALRPVTPSGEPIARGADGWENVYIANGGGSKGVLLSVAIARRIRDLLLQGRHESPGKNSIN